jgi:hypothetical protein
MRALIIDTLYSPEPEFDSGLNIEAETKNGIDAKGLSDSLKRATDPFTADGSRPYVDARWKTDSKNLSRQDNLDEKRYQDGN